MSSAASLARAGRQTKHPIVCINGCGEGDPHVLVQYIEPGSIIRYGTDDDMTCLVVGNYMTYDNYFHDESGKLVTRPRRALLLYGCFCDEPGPFDANRDKRPWEEGRLFEARFTETDSVAVVLEPDMF